MLESREITMKFGPVTALDHVSLKLEPGHIYAMLGPNGSGKTTWMKLATGLLKPAEGEMLWNGAPVGVESRREIAYMSTEPYFYSWMSIRQVGKYYQDFFRDYDPARFDALLARMELDPALKVKNLSSGMMAKLKVAVTLSRRARVWLLDEPFNGIDLIARDAIAQSIIESAGEDRIIVLSSHLVEEMEAIADWAVFIRKGVLVESCDLEEMRQRTGQSMADRYRSIYGAEKEVI